MWLIVGSHAIFAWILLVSSGQTRQVGTLRSLVIVLLLNGVYAWCWANHLFLGKVTAVAGSRSIGVNLVLCTLLLSRYKAGAPSVLPSSRHPGELYHDIRMLRLPDF